MCNKGAGACAGGWGEASVRVTQARTQTRRQADKETRRRGGSEQEQTLSTGYSVLRASCSGFGNLFSPVIPSPCLLVSLSPCRLVYFSDPPQGHHQCRLGAGLVSVSTSIILSCPAGGFESTAQFTV